MSERYEAIKAAKTLKAYCDTKHVFGRGCMDCPLTCVCKSINFRVPNKLSSFLEDAIYELRYADD